LRGGVTTVTTILRKYTLYVQGFYFSMIKKRKSPKEKKVVVTVVTVVTGVDL